MRKTHYLVQIIFSFSLLFFLFPNEVRSQDAGVEAVVSPTSGCNLGGGLVSVKVTNYGATTFSVIPIAFQLDGNAVFHDTIRGINLLPAASFTHFFLVPVSLATPGLHTIQAFTGVVGDLDTSNDTIFQEVDHILTINTFPYAENFENGRGTWISSDFHDGAWELGTPAGGFIRGAASGQNAWMTGLNTNYANSDTVWVTSPCLDFSSLNSPMIRMSVWWRSFFDDETQLEVSINSGPWNAVGNFNDPVNWYNNLDGWGGAGSGWLVAEHAINGTAGESDVRLRIKFASNAVGGSDGFAFDDIVIFNQVPYDLTVVDVVAPLEGCAGRTGDTVKVLVKNTGSQTLDTISVAYQLNGGSSVMQDFTTANIGSGNTATLAFNTPVDLSTPGAYDLKIFGTQRADTTQRNDTASVSFIVAGLPVAAFTFSNNGLNYRFANNSSGVGIGTVLWDFGDGNTGTGNRPNHTYATNGQYIICLSVTDRCGNTAQDCDTINLTVGIEDDLFSRQIKLYPNPNTGLFYLESGNFSEGAQLQITDVNGKIISNFDMPSLSPNETFSIDMRDQNAGVYFAIVQVGERRAVKRILVLK